MKPSNLLSFFLFTTSLFFFSVSLFLRDPVFLKYRYLGLIGINLIGVVWFVILSMHRKKKGILRTLSLLLVLGSMGISLTREASFRYKKNFIQNYDKKALATFANHILVGFHSKDELIELLELPVIGFFITHHNVKNLSIEKTANLINEIQIQRTNRNYSKAFIATDQEGGKVSRLSPPLKMQGSLGDLLDENKDLERIDLAKKIESFTQNQANELLKLGVNVNLSPILDLKFEKKASSMDLYSRIYNRAISKDPSMVSFVAEVYSKKLLEYKILPTLKHFPGLGRVVEDTHFFNASLDTPLTELVKSDLFPFLHIAHNIDYPVMMLSHTTLAAIDSKFPSSISEKVIQNFIRERFPITTVLITDDMNMGPIIYFPGGIGNASLLGLNAGIDILLISYDGEQIYEVLYSLIKADNSSNLNRMRLKESENRLHRLVHFIAKKP